MEETLFNDLVQSLKETKAIARGEAAASRRFKVELPDVKGGAEAHRPVAKRIRPIDAREHEDAPELGAAPGSSGRSRPCTAEDC